MIISQQAYLWKTIAIIFFFGLGLHSSRCQINVAFVDSLKSAIQTQQDTHLVNAYFDLANHYSNNDSISTAIEFFQKGINKAPEIDFDSKLPWLHFYLGVTHDLGGDLESALKAFENSRKYFSKQPNSTYHQTLVSMNIGIAYFYAGDHSNALEHYLDAYEDAKENGFEVLESKLVNNIAIIYRKLKDYDQAMKFYKQSIMLKQAGNNLEGIAASYQNIGLCFSYQNQPDSALWYLNKSKDLNIKVGAPKKEVKLVEFNIANALKELGRKEEALMKYKEFEESNFEFLSDNHKFYCLLFMGNIYKDLTEFKLALNKYDIAEDIFKSTSFKDGLSELYGARAEVRKSLGLYQLSNNDYSKYLSLIKELNEADKRELEVDMLTKYETLQKEEEIKRLALEDKISQQRINQQRNGLFALGGGILLLSFLFYRLFRQKRQIDQQNKEKEVLLKEIHHRVKNNLQVISSLLKLQSRNVSDVTTQEVLAEGQNRVRSMALIHQNLYKDDQITGIHMPTYIKELCTGLLENYSIQENKVDLKIEVEDMHLDVDTVVPIGLIINELITNSLKYAFDGIKAPQISVLMDNDQDSLILIVKDNGNGFDPETVQKDSLGMKLIKSFAKRLQAEYTLQTDNGTIAHFIIKDFD